LLLQLAEQVEQLLAGFRIECAGGFVSQEQFRLIGQCPGDGAMPMIGPCLNPSLSSSRAFMACYSRGYPTTPIPSGERLGEG